MSDCEATPKNLAAHLRLWPKAYGMGAHDTRVCNLSADALERLTILNPDNSNIAEVVDQEIHEKLTVEKPARKPGHSRLRYTTEGKLIIDNPVPDWERFEEFIARVERLEYRVRGLEPSKPRAEGKA